MLIFAPINQTWQHMELHSDASGDDERNKHQNLKRKKPIETGGISSLERILLKEMDRNSMSKRTALHIHIYYKLQQLSALGKNGKTLIIFHGKVFN